MSAEKVDSRDLISGENTDRVHKSITKVAGSTLDQEATYRAVAVKFVAAVTNKAVDIVAEATASNIPHTESATENSKYIRQSGEDVVIQNSQSRNETSSKTESLPTTPKLSATQDLPMPPASPRNEESSHTARRSAALERSPRAGRSPRPTVAVPITSQISLRSDRSPRSIDLHVSSPNSTIASSEEKVVLTSRSSSRSRQRSTGAPRSPRSGVEDPQVRSRRHRVVTGERPRSPSAPLAGDQLLADTIDISETGHTISRRGHDLATGDASNERCEPAHVADSDRLSTGIDRLPVYSTSIEESISPVSADLAGGVDRLVRQFSSRDLILSHDVTTSHYRTQSVDRRIRQEIINGVNYLEKRKNELIEMNKRLQIDVESLTGVLQQLKEELTEARQHAAGLEDEHEELKARLDVMEKEKENEKVRLTDQYLREWKARVKAEEILMENKRDYEIEIKHLREKTCEIATMELNYKKQISNTEKCKDDLRKQLSLLQSEHELDKERFSQMEKSLADWSDRYDSKCREFDDQVQRFLSLKKSFNELLPVNDRQQEISSDGSGCVRTSHSGCKCLPKSPNSTWPTNTRTINIPQQTTHRHSIGESVCIVDLTEQFNPGGSSKASPRLSRGNTGSGDETGSSLPCIKRVGKNPESSQQQHSKQTKQRNVKKQDQMIGASLPSIVQPKL